MAEVVSVAKDPFFVEAGRKGARAHWGPPRICRLDDLPPKQRDLILALVETMKTGSAVEKPEPVATEDHCDGQPSR
jgi:hypothetical protein